MMELGGEEEEEEEECGQGGGRLRIVENEKEVIGKEESEAGG